ncbi:Firmicu-CTERM sorting domain-containing protein [Companilactobacillus baiquanensis]|uniref:Firmicu-CTERM sorting domain-containing protein n=1 Tax=Companilactobacillus baiquanensis TaxID=2486005 RepID=A0ABW1UYT4_9LACO|nr:Firmicu-CTERM sorting domain-containing protein [Companilactobacillus baiquanensis]
MKFRKIIVIGAVILGLAGASSFAEPLVTDAASTDSVTIDGQFSDWKDANLVEGYNGYTSLVSDGQYVNVYVKMKYAAIPGHGDYIFKIGDKSYHAWFPDVNNGDTKQITITGGDNYDGHSYGTVGSGYIGEEDGKSVAEFKIDLSKFDLPDSDVGKSISMTNSNIGSDAATTTIQSVGGKDAVGTATGKADTNEKGTTPTDANANNTNDNLNIVIDGKYLDWKNIQLTEGYNGYTAMVSDGHYVYVYVKMKYGMVPGQGDYHFDFGGKKISVWTKEMPDSLDKDQTKAVNFKAGDYDGGDQYGVVGNGYVTNNGEHNVGEFRIDISKLNISTMVGQTITMNNPSIGNEKVTTSGGSTGPILISGIGVLIAGFGYVKLKKAGYLKNKIHISGK